MKIILLTHADFEGPGVLSNLAAPHQLDIFKSYHGEELPSIDDYDLLIVMGGPQSASSEYEKYPYLAAEVELIKSAIEQNKKILGICLGAQLISRAFDIPAVSSPYKEIGYFPIHMMPVAKSDPIFYDFDSSIPAFHWHGDMPGYSDDFAILASSPGCPRQIIRFSKFVYGLQCHFEITSDGVMDLLTHCAGDLKPGKFVQSADKIKPEDPKEVNEIMGIIFRRLLEL